MPPLVNKLTVSVTKYTSTSGSQSKTYTLKGKTIEKTPSAQMYEGTAERITIPFEDFVDALSTATDNQAFGYGLHDQNYPDEVTIVVKEKVQPTDNILSRSKEFFNYRKQPGILMLDHDPSEYGSTLTADELIEILITIDPNIAKAARIVRGSLSAGVHLKGKKPKKSKGFHIYIPVKDASDIPRYGKLLYKHLWLKGSGYIALGSIANKLEKSAIDEAVFREGQLDFVGKPIIADEGLTYTELTAEYKSGSYLHTSRLANLTDEETKEVDRLIAQAKKEIEPARKLKEEAYKKHKIKTIIETTGSSIKEATVLVTKIIAGKGKNLWGNSILEFSEDDVTVAEVLKNHEKYDGRSLADPHESRKYGKTTAMFWWNDGKPIIHSFAHGQKVCYFLYLNEPGKYIKEVEPYFSEPDYQSKDAACEEMTRVVKQWITNPTPHLGITAPAGIGKTKTILQQVAKVATKKFIEIYVPTHSLAKEVKDTLLQFNAKLNIEVIRGRTYSDEETGGVAPCKKSALIESIQRYGYNIYKDVCKDCEFFSPPEQCDYLRQFDDATQVRIFTHKHLPLSRGLDNKMPDLAIIDESFFIDMIDIKETTINRIKRYIDNKLLVDVLVDSLNNKEPLLAKLHEQFGDDVISTLKNASRQVNPKLPLVQSTTDAVEIKKKLGSKTKKKQNLVIMLKQLIAEIEKFPERKTSLTVRLIKEKVSITNRHELNRFKHISSGNTTYVPVLCIDADFCKEVVDVFLPDIQEITLPVERNAYITQVYSTTNAKTRFMPRGSAAEGERESEAADMHIKNNQDIINNVCSDYGPALIVGYQKVVGNPKNNILSKLVLPKGCEAIHFGALRGLNKFKYLDTVIIIGRHQLPIDALESKAAAIWWDSDKELVLTGKLRYEKRGYRFRETDKKMGVSVMVCEDHRAQLLQHLQRESESLQAIDRIRLIHNDEPKNVFLLSNLPLNITVDNLVSFKELVRWKSKIEKALMRASHGVLPLSSEYLVTHYPELFTNESMAKNTVKDAGLGETIQYFIQSKKPIKFNRKEYTLYSFRVMREKGRPKKALAPRKMIPGAVKQHLKTIFKNNVEILECTYRGLRLEDARPKPDSIDDDLVTKYEREHKKYIDSVKEEEIYYDLLSLPMMPN